MGSGDLSQFALLVTHDEHLSPAQRQLRLAHRRPRASCLSSHVRVQFYANVNANFPTFDGFCYALGTDGADFRDGTDVILVIQ